MNICNKCCALCDNLCSSVCVCVVRSKVLQSKEISFRPHRITYWQVDHRLTTAHKMYRNSAFMAYIQMLYCTPKPKIATARTHTHTLGTRTLSQVDMRATFKCITHCHVQIHANIKHSVYVYEFRVLSTFECE